MPDLKVQQQVWDEIRTAAAKQGQRPESLANRALKEYLQRLADEELIAESQREARRAPLKVRDTERAIREHRAKRRRERS